MSLAEVIYVLRWLVRDTFRQARASGVFWLMLGVSALSILVCASVGVSGTQVPHDPHSIPEYLSEPARQPRETAEQYQKRLAEFRAQAEKSRMVIKKSKLTLAFGAIDIDMARQPDEVVSFLQLLLAFGVADTGGLMLALLWTAGFLPTFLEPSAAAVLLAKPTPRWLLLVGKYFGVLVFVAFQAIIFVGGTSLALLLRTGEWNWAYALGVPLLLLLHFAIFYGFSAFLAVCTRNTVACLFGSILFWFVCWGMNFGRHAIVVTPEFETMPATFRYTVEAGYWVLPKPADFGMLLANALHADQDFAPAGVLLAVQQQGHLAAELSVLSSLLFTAVILSLAARQLTTTDY
jgi:ABC-type transport system involved in multi-copper enzyme maturation permease subunit